jgi:hypothetical protein
MKPFVREILQAARIADLKAAVGVPPPSLDGLTPEERCLVERFEAALQAEYDCSTSSGPTPPSSAPKCKPRAPHSRRRRRSRVR